MIAPPEPILVPKEAETPTQEQVNEKLTAKSDHHPKFFSNDGSACDSLLSTLCSKLSALFSYLVSIFKLMREKKIEREVKKILLKEVYISFELMQNAWLSSANT